MAQQLQYPQGSSVQGQQGWSQQFQPQYQSTVGQWGAGQQFGRRFEESVPFEIQQVSMDLDRLETVCEWAKSRAVERGRPRVAALCDDLAEVAHLEKHLLVRQSPFAQPVGQATLQTIQQGIQELQQHASEPEAQEAVTQAQQTAQNIQQALNRIGSQGMGTQGTGTQGTQGTGTQGPFQAQTYRP